MTTCPNCSAGLADTAKFCAECGTAVAARSCPSCGAPADRGRFCTECGSAINTPDRAAVARTSTARPVAERRITSVLFADLVGFTPLSEARDPEEVRELLSRYFDQCRTVIGRYGGTVEKFIGDAVMAVWGVPTTREDDAERAVRAGLELAETVSVLGESEGAPGLAARVGVVTGEVAVTLGATGEGMVAGDAVNTAARVQAAAEPGQVWVDDTTRSMTSAAIAYRDTGEHSLKGKAQQVRLWHARAVVAEVGGAQRIDGLEAPLAGRDRELRLIKELFHSTEESSRPRLVVVDGEAGVGKSRLVWEFEKYCDGLSAQIRWHRGRCLSYGDGVAFWALAEVVRTRVGLHESDTGDNVTQRLDAALEEFVPDTDERDWIRPRLAGLVGAGVPTANFAREDLFAAWRAFLERVSGGHEVVVIVIDDAQYADDGLLDFLDYLLATAQAPIFVTAMARPELLVRRPQLGGRRTTVVRLDPLDDPGMRGLVDGLVSGLPEHARAQLVERAEGIPLFAVETVRALIDRDAIVPRGGQYVPSEGADLDLDAIGAPASLQALVAARLDSLAPDERRVVNDACVLGAAFTREGIEALDPGLEGLDVILETLQGKEIISVQQDRFAAEHGQYRFVQAVVRQVAYSTLSRRDRKARHLAAANYLSALPNATDELAVVVAQHLLDAVDASGSGDSDVEELTSRARDLLERAGARAAKLGSPSEARRAYEAALARAHEPADQARLHLAVAEVAGYSGDLPGAVDQAAQAVALYDELGKPVDAGVAAAMQSRMLTLLNDYSAALAVAQPRWDALDGVAGAERALLELTQPLLNASYQSLHDPELGDRYLQRRIHLAEELSAPEQLAGALNAMGVNYASNGAPSTGAALYEAAARLARDHDVPAMQAQALMNLGTVRMSRDLDAAIASYLEAREAGRRAGSAPMIDWIEANYAGTLLAAGRLRESAQVAANAHETVTTPTPRSGLALIDMWLSEAMGTPLSPYEEPAVHGDAWDRAAAGLREINQRLRVGDMSGAVALVPPTMEQTMESCALDDDFMHFWPPLVRVAIQAGDVPLAEHLLEPVLRAPSGIVSDAVAGHLLNLRGLVAAMRGDDPDEVELYLRGGVAALIQFGAVAWAARAEEDLARWLVAQGNLDAARTHLEHVADTYREIGADGWLAPLEAWMGELSTQPLR